jgi:hypothetical protein
MPDADLDSTPYWEISRYTRYDLKLHWEVGLRRRSLYNGVYTYFNLSGKIVKDFFTDTVDIITS